MALQLGQLSGGVALVPLEASLFSSLISSLSHEKVKLNLPLSGVTEPEVDSCRLPAVKECRFFLHRGVYHACVRPVSRGPRRSVHNMYYFNYQLFPISTVFQFPKVKHSP